MQLLPPETIDVEPEKSTEPSEGDEQLRLFEN